MKRIQCPKCKEFPRWNPHIEGKRKPQPGDTIMLDAIWPPRSAIEWIAWVIAGAGAMTIVEIGLIAILMKLT